MGWHLKWKADMRLDTINEKCQQHEAYCRWFEEGICTDQLNLPDLVCAELQARRLQLLEEQCYETLLRQSAGGKKKGGKGQEDPLAAEIEAQLFLGSGASKGNMCICPALAEWLSDQLKAEASIAKERRKARDERRLGGGKDE